VGPTVPEGASEFTRYNFSETFDCPPFTTMSPVIEIGRNGEPVKNRRGGKSSGQTNVKRAEQIKSGQMHMDLPSFQNPPIGLKLCFPQRKCQMAHVQWYPAELMTSRSKTVYWAVHIARFKSITLSRAKI